MANIVIKEILASDTVSNLVDKINFNFDQLLLNGGGPIGLTGSVGPTGPLGPRGTVWFTSGDIYNTDLTTTAAPPLLFPLWTGTPLKVNNASLPGYPQFKGDPNRYLPIATPATPNTYPYFSFTIGTTGKIPKSGDLYLQEGDDNFNSYSSVDGDIWEFNSVANTWTFTGVNIKGSTGSTGATGATEWIRTTDPGIIDAIHPYVVTGQDPVVRVLVGTDDTTVIEEPSTGVYTDNVMTIYKSLSTAGYNLAFTDANSITAPSFSTSDYANISTNSNTFTLQGFSSLLSDNYNVVLNAPAGSIYLQANAPVLGTNIDVTLDLQNRKFSVVNAALDVSCSPLVPPVGAVVHTLTDTETTLNIRHNQSSTYGGWANKFIRLQARATSGVADLILSDTTSIDTRVGIGEWVTGRPSGKFTVSNSGSATVPAVVVGSTWSNSSTTPTFTNATVDVSSIQSSTYMAGMLTIGATNTFGFPTIFGSSSLNSLSTANGIGIKSGLLTFNAYSDNIASPSLRGMGTSNYGNYAFGHGRLLSTFTLANAGDLTPDTFVLTSSDTVISTQGTALTGGLQGSQPFNVNLFLKSNTRQFGFNTTFNSGNADFNSRGGAVIGKIKSFSGESFFGHEDVQANRNIILGWPKDYSGSNTTRSPRVVVTSPIDTNLIYLTTPTWSGSMRFNSNGDPAKPTIRSYTSSASSAYEFYFPSLSAQNKIINGINYPVISTQLGFDSNPYDTGLGLEIETRILASSTPSGSITRTPVTRWFEGGVTNYVKGNRPLLIGKRDLSDNTQILLEVSSTNNVAVGGVIKYPTRSVFNLYRTSGIPDAMGFAPDSSAPSGSAVTTSYNSPWGSSYLVSTAVNNSSSYSSIITNLSTFVTGDFDRSLHINTIYPNNTGQNNIDQHNGKVKAGIVINSEALNINTPNSTNALHYKSYADSLFQSYHQITTSPLMVNFTGGIDTGLKSSVPLGVKPGPVTFRNNTPISNYQLYTKGSDLVLSAGDFVYQFNSAGPQFPNFSFPPKAGDVFITGGQIFKDVINSNGLTNAITDIITGPYSDVEKRNFGNIYIGSNINPVNLTNNTNSPISKTSIVYVGYQSNDTSVFNVNLSDFSPKGNASLNVAAPSDAVLNDQTPTLKSNNKALNIQKGDIVTANQDAGWVTINLADPAFINVSNGISNIFYASSNPTTSNIEYGRYLVGSSVRPRWNISYKVIGYTVFYKLIVQSILWETDAGGTNDSPYIFASDNLFGNRNSGKMPSPLLKTDAFSPYPDSLRGQYTYANPIDIRTNTSKSFSGHGHVSIRQDRGAAIPFPLNDYNTYITGNQNIELLRVPIEANIFANGSVPLIQITASGAGTYLWSDSGNYDTDITNPNVAARQEVQTMLDYNYKKLVPFAGNRFTFDGTSQVSGAQIQLDIFFSGQYELDPNTWFV
jgi:hypothetical protein